MEITRRRAFVSTGCLSFALASLTQSTFAQTPGQDAPIEFSWELPRSSAAPTAARLGLKESNISPAPDGQTDRGVPILLIIAGIVALGLLADEIMHVYRDIKYGGLIIQAKEGKLEIKNDPRLPTHVIIISDKNGVTVKELEGQGIRTDLVKALSGLVAKSKG